MALLGICNLFSSSQLLLSCCLRLSAAGLTDRFNRLFGRYGYPYEFCNREEKVNGSRFNNGFARNGNHQCPEGCDRTSGTTVLHVGGLSILLGYRAKIGAWLIVVFLLIVTPLMHNFWGLTHPMMAQVQMIMFLKNVSMLGGALLIAQFGAGPLSLDARRSL